MSRTDTPLRRELDRRGIRYSWMARQLGVQPWSFSRYEDELTPAPDGYWERAAEILNVPFDKIAPQGLLAAQAA